MMKCIIDAFYSGKLNVLGGICFYNWLFQAKKNNKIMVFKSS